MKILVTGGAGYLGSVLVPHLLENNYKVTVLDNLYYRQNSLFHLCYNKNFEFILGDARDAQLISRIISKFDVIIPLAALVGATACDKDPNLATELNLNAVKSILKYRSKSQMIILPNTNSGYGIGETNDFCTEDSALNPISLYGKTKVEVEKAVLDAGDTITLRLATVFGISPRMRLDLLVNDFVYQAINNRVLVLFEEHFKRNYIHIRDIAYTFKYCIDNFEKLKDEPYNVGLSAANLSKRELAEKIKEHIPELTIISSEIGKDPDKRDYIVSNEKLEKKGWLPRYTLDDGIEELIKGYNMIQLHNFWNI
jgi:nucleoside-diphosphate-sugar epimerase